MDYMRGTSQLKQYDSQRGTSSLQPQKAKSTTDVKIQNHSSLYLRATQADYETPVVLSTHSFTSVAFSLQMIHLRNKGNITRNSKKHPLCSAFPLFPSPHFYTDTSVK